MNQHLTDETLNDYIDGELPEPERQAAAQHLTGCPECRRAHESLTDLLRDAAALPTSVEPERDLWPAIADRITGMAPGSAGTRPSRGNRFWLTWGGSRMPLAAAALLVVAAGAVLLIGQLDQQPITQVATQRSALEPNASVVRAAAAQVEANYETALEEYLTTLAARRGEFSPETIEVIEENLLVIDQAIEEIRAAIDADPGSRDELVPLLVAGYRSKLDLLRRAVQIPPSEDMEGTT